jgi:hypothetical protein
MDWIALPMFLSFLLIVFMSMKSGQVEQEMYAKYDIRTWYHGFFKHRKMLRMLNDEDKAYYNAKTKKYGRVQFYAFLFIIVYSITVGIIRTKMGYIK